jgi:hypothetical protein
LIAGGVSFPISHGGAGHHGGKMGWKKKYIICNNNTLYQVVGAIYYCKVNISIPFCIFLRHQILQVRE